MRYINLHYLTLQYIDVMFPVAGILTYCTELLTMDRFATCAKFDSGSVLTLSVSLMMIRMTVQIQTIF